MAAYPYLFVVHPPYGKYPDYKAACDAIRVATRDECEQFVREVWPHAYIYQHGPDWTVVPMGWRDIANIRESNPELQLPGNLSATINWKTYVTRWDDTLKKYIPLDEVEFARRDAYMWRLAAATMIEHSYSKELAAQKEEADAAIPVTKAT